MISFWLFLPLLRGIPKRDVDELQRYWKVFPATREALFKQNRHPDYLIARVPSHEVKTTLLDSSEYQDYAHKAKATLKSWQDKCEPYLKSLEKGCKPKDVIGEISEDLLTTFSAIPLIDKYDVYQHLMNYWFEVMQDDVYQISAQGWKEASRIHRIIDENDPEKKIKEAPDIVIGSGQKAQKFKAELIPPKLIVQRYYAEEQKGIDEEEAQREAVVADIEELTEQHSGEEGWLEEVKTKTGKLSQTNLKARIKEIKNEDDSAHEMLVLTHAQDLLEVESIRATNIKEISNGNSIRKSWHITPNWMVQQSKNWL